MWGVSGGLSELIILTVSAIAGAAILGFGKAVMSLMRTRQTKQRMENDDERTRQRFFFDQPADPRTGTPATTGWTTTVNATLRELAAGQTDTAKKVDQILYELMPNGGGNFRGMVEKNAAAAQKEVGEQVAERGRVKRRDDRTDTP